MLRHFLALKAKLFYTIIKYHSLRAIPVRSKANLYEVIIMDLLTRGNKGVS